MAIDGRKNAGIMAVKMLAVGDDGLLAKLKEYSEKQKKQVMSKDEKLKKTGYKAYLSDK